MTLLDLRILLSIHEKNKSYGSQGAYNVYNESTGEYLYDFKTANRVERILLKEVKKAKELIKN